MTRILQNFDANLKKLSWNGFGASQTRGLAGGFKACRKILQSIRILNDRPLSRIRKWNQLSQFRRTSKVIPIEKT